MALKKKVYKYISDMLRCRMEKRDSIFLAVMVLSSFLLSVEWLRRFPSRASNPLIVISVVVLIGTLSIMLISLNARLRELEEKIEARDRSLRLNLEGGEANVEDKMNEIITKVDNAIYELKLRKYH